MKYKITLGYDGGGFCGWQHQPSGNSVQDAVEDAVKALTGESVRVTGSGRTDAGVHALGQVAHFETQKDLPIKTVIGGLNAHLPKKVRVLAAEQVAADFDARKSAKRKTYMYLMYRGKEQPVLFERALFVGDVNVDAMRREAKKVIGAHDFAAFMAAGSSAKTSTRTVFDAHIDEDGEFIKFFITADGFLYNMVRIISAQLILAGRGTPVDLEKLIAGKDRTAAKETAPPYALYLYNVEY